MKWKGVYKALSVLAGQGGLPFTLLPAVPAPHRSWPLGGGEYIVVPKWDCLVRSWFYSLGSAQELPGST